MCDYSLHAQKTRPAKVGDKLIVSGFRDTVTQGLRQVDGFLDTATCLLPGTEVAFDAPPVVHERSTFFSGHHVGPVRKIDSQVARFRQINLNSAMQHHDAFEFANGEIVLVNDLARAERLTVLQLGVEMPAVPAVERANVTLRERLSADTVFAWPAPGLPQFQAAGINFVNPNSGVQGGLTSSEGQHTSDLVAGISAPAK